MSTEERIDGAVPTPLPELAPERIDEIETALFADIAKDRHTRSARRGRWWIGGAAAAAVIVVAAVIAPSVGTIVGGAGGSSDSAVAPDGPAVAPESDGDLGETFTGADESAGRGESDAGAAELTDDATRDIITSASATLEVDDVPVAAETIAAAAEARDGYVESMSIGRSGEAIPVDPDTGIAYDSMTYPYTPDGAWITVRVPADELTGMVRELSALGQVTASSVNRQDVTEQTVDLRARIETAEASVDRLTELMGEATSVADLIAAESALAERQATLEAYQAQLESLETMVAMSSLTVTLVPETVTVEADPAGFADGWNAGWNGLVATLNGIVVALGFLIPWILVAGLAALVVWGIVRFVRRRRAARRADAAARASVDTPE
ncbi:DUF4349 domain-containing protein [Microbacterium sp. CFBP9034]|uniref:DUF4349 domain-containing protein n=1 Tax=Microbacterium sp. CFBP9034 TaxID=3096540 RepID=UPI002A6A40C5|nr:DUF4349 domain-containing protein [Microbacterium sp. CFBP9034]MDY0909454.1 DUF4349 domain-containing protein [Microbacterium sp. CFBP9034]